MGGIDLESGMQTSRGEADGARERKFGRDIRSSDHQPGFNLFLDFLNGLSFKLTG